ncbi:hypothetical protein [Sphingomonas zeae]
MPLWQALRSAKAPRTIAQLQAACQVDYGSVHVALKRWQARGAVVRHPGKPLRFGLAPTARTDTPPDGRSEEDHIRMRLRTARQRIWTAMRVLKTFDAPTLRMSADATEKAVSIYLYQLQQGGYVRVVERGSSKTGRLSVYRLQRNSGPNCPTIRRPRGSSHTQLVDNNTGKTVDISPGVALLRKTKTEASADGGVS